MEYSVLRTCNLESWAMDLALSPGRSGVPTLGQAKLSDRVHAGEYGGYGYG
jgi:hypothetical protein